MNSISKIGTFCLASLSLLSCQMNVVIGGIATSTNTSVSHQYVKFDGKESYKIHGDDLKSIKVEITTKSGILDLVVSNENETPYEGHIDNDMTFTINVKPGNYTINLQAHNHSGSYKFDWGN